MKDFLDNSSLGCKELMFAEWLNDRTGNLLKGLKGTKNMLLRLQGFRS